MNILAVDDDNLMLELLVAALAETGHHNVMPVNSPISALDLIDALSDENDNLDRASFDCILLDIQMPEMDGIELCRRIRSKPAYRNTPILMITSMTDRSFIDRAFEAGATDYVTKPFDQFELAARIRMAKTLVTEQRKAFQSFFVASAMYTGLSDKKQAIFESPLSIEGVPKVVDYLVLENYLLQLSKKSVHRTVAIAFSIKEAKDAFELLNEEEYYGLLMDVAKVLASSLGETKFLISYFGSGFFVCVTDKSNYGSIRSLEVSKHVMKKSYKKLRPTVIVGDPIDSPITQSDDVHSLVLDAISSVAQKSMHEDKFPMAIKQLQPKAAKYNISLRD